MTPPGHATLKARQRAERDHWPRDFGLRLHRAISWIGRAEAEHDPADPDAEFLFLWIAFNAAYGAEGSDHAARQDFEQFFQRLLDCDGDGRLYDMVWSIFTGPIRLLLENPYIFAPFWAHQRGDIDAQTWESKFAGSRRAFHRALQHRNTAQLLCMMFDRLYVLRNQLIHGASTWNSALNRDQLTDGAAILRSMVPVMVDIMMSAPLKNWGTSAYPALKDAP